MKTNSIKRAPSFLAYLIFLSFVIICLNDINANDIQADEFFDGDIVLTSISINGNPKPLNIIDEGESAIVNIDFTSSQDLPEGTTIEFEWQLNGESGLTNWNGSLLSGDSATHSVLDIPISNLEIGQVHNLLFTVISVDGELLTEATELTSTILINPEEDHFALTFDGIDDLVSITSQAQILPANDSFTIEFWFKTQNIDQLGPIFSNRQPIAPFNLCSFNINDGSDPRYIPAPGKKLTFSYGDASTTLPYRSITTVNDIVDGEFHHVAGVIDPSSQNLKLYVDGVEQEVSEIATGAFPTLNNSAPIVLGNNNNESYFTGIIDELRIWSTARTQQEVIANMVNNENLAQEETLIAWWDFGEAVGQTITDQVNQLEGELIGGVQFEPSGAPVIDFNEPMTLEIASLEITEEENNLWIVQEGQELSFEVFLSVTEPLLPSTELELEWNLNGQTGIHQWSSESEVSLTSSTTVIINPNELAVSELDTLSIEIIAINGQMPSGETNNSTLVAVNPEEDHFALNLTALNARIVTGTTLDVYNNFTMEFWINPVEPHEIDLQSNTGTSGTEGQHYTIYPDQGEVQFGSPNYAGLGVSAGTNGISLYEHAPFHIPALLVHEQVITGWTYVAIVVDNKVPTLFINGELAAIGEASLRERVYPSVSHVGGLIYGNFSGEVDELKVWDYPKTPEEILAGMVQNDTILESPELRAYWDFSPTGNGVTKNLISQEPATFLNDAIIEISGAPVLDQEVQGDFQLTSLVIAGEPAIPSQATTIVNQTETVDEIAVLVSNDAVYDLTSLTLSWTINGVPQTPVNWTGSIPSFDIQPITLSTDYVFEADSTYQIDVVGSLPNGDSIPVLPTQSTSTFAIVQPLQDHYAMNFDGSGDYIKFQNIDDLPTGNAAWTIESWTKGNTQGTLVQLGNSSNSHIVLLRIDGNVSGKATIDAGGNAETITDPEYINSTKWVHLAGTYNGDTLKLYVDGKLIEAKFILDRSIEINDVFIGQSSSGFSTISGQLDNIRIWDYARTAEQIKLNMSRLIDATDDEGLVFNLAVTPGEFDFPNATVTETASASLGALYNLPDPSVLVNPGAPVLDPSIQEYNNDIAILDQSLESACGLTSVEQIQVTLFNNGIQAVDSIYLGFILNTTVSNMELIDTLLNPGDTLIWTMAQNANLLQQQENSLSVFISQSDDENALNDSITTTISSYPELFLNVTQDTTICDGSIIRLQANGATTYSWSGDIQGNNSNNPFIDIIATSQNTYYVSGANAFGCNASDSVSVSINPLPVQPEIITATQTICPDQETLVIITNYDSTMFWQDAIFSDTLSVNMPGLYKAVNMDPNTGCVASDSLLIENGLLPSIDNSVFTSLCAGDEAILSVLNATTAVWSEGGIVISSELTASGFPTGNTTYHVNANSSDGCELADSISFVILQNTDISEVTGLFPFDGTTQIPTDQTLSWTPSENASLYDLYLWESDEAEPSTPTIANISETFSFPEIEFSKDYSWKIVAKNSCSEEFSETQQFSTNGQIDFITSIDDIPENTVAGSSFPVEFTVTNLGDESTGSYAFKVYFAFSSDGEDLRENEDIYVLEIPNLTYLLAGQSYTQVVDIPVPNDINGTWFLFASADNKDAVCTNCEDPYRGCHCNAITKNNESNENNNAVSAPIFIAPAPSPDLIVGSFGGSNNAQAASSYTASIIELNQGNFLVSQQRRHRFFASTDSDFEPSGDVYIGQYTSNSTIQPGGADTILYELDLPHTLNGEYIFYVVLDYFDDIAEFNGEQNNIGFKADTVTVLGTALADLVIQELIVPETALNNAPLLIQGTGTNIGGAAPYENSFSTEYKLCPLPELSGDCISLGGPLTTSAGSISPSSSVNINHNYFIPIELFGSFYLVGTIDSNDQVFEETPDDDNQSSFYPVEILLKDTVDLTIDCIGEVLEDTSGTSLSFDYTILSEGSNLPYTDFTVKVYRANNANFTSQSLLTEYDVSPQEFTNGAINKTVNYLIPFNNSGSLFFKIVLDAEDDNYEHLAEDNNECIIEYDIQLSDYADLTVEQLNSSATSANRGDTIFVSYDISNTLDWPTSPRADRVRLKRSIEFIDTLISIPSGDDLLGIETFDIGIVIPNDVDYGSYGLFIDLDLNNQVFEFDGESNNFFNASNYVTILPQYTDIAAAISSSPSSLYTGESATIQYSLSNIGQYTTDNSQTTLKASLSLDGVLSSDDILVGNDELNQFINAGTVLDENMSISIPQWVEPGNYQLLLSFNDQGSIQNDSNAVNDIAVVPIQILLTDPINLTLTSDFDQFNLIAGQPLSINTVIGNSGIGTSPSSGFRVSASINNSPDLSTLPAGSTIIQVTNTLATGGNLNLTLNTVVAPFLEGNYYLVLKVDHFDNIFEYQGEDDNVIAFPIQITAPLPSDLYPSTVQCQPTVVLGEDFFAQVTIVNGGENAAVGNLANILEASTDNVIGDDFFLTNKNQVVNIPPGDSITVDFTKRLTNLKDGDYQIVVNTNSLAQIPEIDFSNNKAIDSHSFSVSVMDLELETPTQDILDLGFPIYYKIVVPEDNVDLLIKLESLNQLGGFNEVYVAKDRIPSALDFDAKQLEENEVDVQVLMPSIDSGVYYLMAIANTSFPNSQEVELLARALPFGITEVSPNVVGQGQVTTTFIGSGFKSNMKICLVNTELDTMAMGVVSLLLSSMEAQVSWNLSNVPIGAYSISVESLEEYTAYDEFLVQPITTEFLQAELYSPEAVLIGRNSRYQVDISNESNTNHFLSSVNIRVPYETAWRMLSTSGDYRFGPFNIEPIAQLTKYPHLGNTAFQEIQFWMNNISPLSKESFEFEIISAENFNSSFSITTTNYTEIEYIENRILLNEFYRSIDAIESFGLDLNQWSDYITQDIAALDSLVSWINHSHLLELDYEILQVDSTIVDECAYMVVVIVVENPLTGYQDSLTFDFPPCENVEGIPLYRGDICDLTDLYGAPEIGCVIDDDQDFDGLKDEFDPNDSNTDTDNDLIPDGADVDVDGDGQNDNGVDSDGDGINDKSDSDQDGDGEVDNGNDKDGDGVNDENDLDDDNNGIDDKDESDDDGLGNENGDSSNGGVGACQSTSDCDTRATKVRLFNLRMLRTCYGPFPAGTPILPNSPGLVIGVVGGVSTAMSAFGAFCTFGFFIVENKIQKEYEKCVQLRRSCDPNQIIGPGGNGINEWLQAQSNLPYQIYFENDSVLASAAAQVVQINLPLDTNMNIYSFELGDYNFGQYTFSIPDGLSFYSQQLDLTEELGLRVQVTAGVNIEDHEAYWIFESLDPFTLLPPYSPDAGFLAINDSLGNGEGYVSFSIQPISTVQTGDSISAQAEIVFDINEPIITNTWVNYIDADAPSSEILAITPDTASMALVWTAEDQINGSGISHVDIFAKTSGEEEFTVLGEEINYSPFYFQGTEGEEYELYTLATDTAGNQEVWDESVFTISYESFEMDTTEFAIGCPAQIVLVNDPGECFATESAFGLEFETNCFDSLALTVTNNLGFEWPIDEYEFPLGVTELVWTVTDCEGNIESCTTNVLVLDQEEPVLISEVSPTDTICLGENPEFFTPEFIDNCGEPVNVTFQSTLQTGINTWKWTASDASGNQTVVIKTFILESCVDPDVCVPENFPNAPTNGTTIIEDNMLTLLWDPVPDAVVCQIQGRLVGGPQQSFLVGTDGYGPQPLNMLIPGVTTPLNQDFEWRVRCGCNADPVIASPWSEWYLFTTTPDEPINITEFEIFEMELFPNPFNEELILRSNMGQAEDAKIEVRDMKGRVLFVQNIYLEQGVEHNRLDLDEIAAGIYILTVSAGTKMESQRIVKYK